MVPKEGEETFIKDWKLMVATDTGSISNRVKRLTGPESFPATWNDIDHLNILSEPYKCTFHLSS